MKIFITLTLETNLYCRLMDDKGDEGWGDRILFVFFFFFTCPEVITLSAFSHKYIVVF